MNIKEMRKLLPCRMLVWDDDETTARDRVVTEIFNNGSCRSVDGDSEAEYLKGECYAVWTYKHCKPISKKVTRPAELINDILKQHLADMEELTKMGLDPVFVAHGMMALQIDVSMKIRDLLHGDYKIGGIIIGNSKDSNYPENVIPNKCPNYKNYSVIGDIDKFHNIVNIKCDPVDEIALAERLREALKPKETEG